MAKMKNQSDRRVVYAFLILLGFFLFMIGMVFIGSTKSGRLSGHKDQDMIRSVYERVDPQEARDGIFRLMELLSSEGYKQADPDVRSSGTATLEEFLLVFGPALDKAERTGKTGYLGLLRAMMSGDKDAELFYRRELGLL